MKKLVIRSLAALAATLGLSVAAVAQNTEPKVLNIYNWSDYIAEDTIKNFEKETGIKVRYDNYDTNEILHAKLMAGKSGYDIVVPGAPFAKMQIDGGLLQKLDRSQLKNWNNLDPALLELLARVDPGNQYLVDWLWGYITVGINVPLVKKALGDLPMPENPWSLIFDPKYASKLKSCGVNFLDSASEVLPLALLHVGKPAYSRNVADYKDAAEMLKKVRPFVTRFSSSGYINDLAGGSLCAVMGYSGDINIARARAIEAGKGPIIEALVPKSGATLFFDVMAIPGRCPAPEERAPVHRLHPASRGARLADQQGLLRQPEQGLAEVRQARRGQQPQRLPQRRGQGRDDRARTGAAGHPPRADAHLHQLQGGQVNRVQPATAPQQPPRNRLCRAAGGAPWGERRRRFGGVNIPRCSPPDRRARFPCTCSSCRRRFRASS